MTTAVTRPLRINPAALAQRVDQQLRSHRAGPDPVLLVGAEPVWPHEATLTTPDKHEVRVVPCVSTLAIWEQLAAPREGTLVLLTDLSERELGTGILSEVFRQRVITVEPWDLVAEVFGAQRLDPRLEAETWAGEALLDAMPPEGWPKLAGTVLSRDQALRHLAVVRLTLDRLQIGPDDLDARALLRWSALPAAGETLDQLRESEREGLVAWLVAEYGRPAQVLFALREAGHLADALPLGLICAAVWSSDNPDALRAQGRIEQYFGGGRLAPATVRAYAEAVTDVVADSLRADSGTEDRRTGAAVLDRAEELLGQFDASAAARHSTMLRIGFEHRADQVAAALRAALADPSRTPAAAAALDELARHHLAAGQPHRVERARMALRLVRWLATGEGTAGSAEDPVADPAAAGAPVSVADGVTRQITQWGWVDLALAHVWTGDDAHPGLKRAYRAVYDRAAGRRRALDQAFAGHLSTWLAADTPPGTLLTVDQVLDKVVAPVVRSGDRPVLLVVLDGMSAAVAADLAADLTRQHWVEYDPLPSADRAHRRGALAAVPSVTAVSRATLFAGAPRQGGAAEERAAFESHPRWRGRPARLFHKSLITGGAGEVLDQDLEAALAEPDTLVAVVINTIDDALYYGRESVEPGWRVDQVGPLRTLLDHARYHGRAVVITSDHGHITDRDTTLRQIEAAASARHRTGTAPAGDGEVELAGPRVAGGRVVALWDRGLRYLPRRAGYHGGASLAEMTAPVLAFLHLGAAAPRTWRPLPPDLQPDWWSIPVEVEPASPDATAQPVPRPRAAGKPAPADQPLFELAPAPSLVDAVLESEMFAAQRALTPRTVPLPKIRGALAALVEANGVLPAVVVAQRAGEQPERATGFITTLQTLFNVDSYPVLSRTGDGHTVRLNLALLREQFDVPGAAR